LAQVSGLTFSLIPHSAPPWFWHALRSREVAAPVRMGLASSQLGIGGFLALQFAFQPLLTRWFVSPACIKSSVILVCELAKFVACLLILGVTGELRSWKPKDAIWAAGPALTYTVQNVCTQTAYQNLDGMTFNVINQSKILFNALFVFFIIGDGQTPLQMLALLFIFAASVLVSVGDAAGGGSQNGRGIEEDLLLGAACCAVGTALSGFGSAITELVLVGKQKHALMFSAELAFFSVLILLVNLALDLNGDGTSMRSQGFFSHWDEKTIVPVLANSLGGLAVGAVTKLAGSVRKGIALTIGLILSAVLRILVTGRSCPLSVGIAVPIASAGIFLHMSQPRLRRAAAKKERTE